MAESSGADPNNRVVLCGFAGVEHRHLEAVYRLGGKDYFDILGATPTLGRRCPKRVASSKRSVPSTQ